VNSFTKSKLPHVVDNYQFGIENDIFYVFYINKDREFFVSVHFEALANITKIKIRTFDQTTFD
jgi:hypothetical protein